MSATRIGEWALSGAILAIVIWQFVVFVVNQERRTQLRLRAAWRAPRVERAAIEAALTEPVFEPERIRADVQKILRLATEVWNTGGRSQPDHRPDGPLIAAWARQRLELYGKPLSIRGTPKIDLMRIVNRERPEDDRVVLRVRFRIQRDPTQYGLDERFVLTDERWKLARRGEKWLLASVAGDPLAKTLSKRRLIATPDQDDERLQEASLQELSGHTDLGEISPGELTDPQLAAELRLQDLSVVDDRFAPPLIEAALKHIVEAWEDASDGSKQDLRDVSTRLGARQLTFEPRAAARRLVRDAVLRSWKVLELEANAEPSTLTVEVRLRGAVYYARASRVSGNDRAAANHKLQWKLQLGDDADGRPRWRLAGSRDL